VLIVYGIQSCDTCRKARKYLTGHNIEHKFHDFRVDGLDIQKLERWAERIGYERLLNKQSLTWRKIPEVDRADMNRSKALAAMIDQPTLIKRPVLESDNFIAVGFSEKRFGDYLERLG
jgi:Spx/MgsR family transcriptional regulator